MTARDDHGRSEPAGSKKEERGRGKLEVVLVAGNLVVRAQNGALELRNPQKPVQFNGKPKDLKPPPKADKWPSYDENPGFLSPFNLPQSELHQHKIRRSDIEVHIGLLKGGKVKGKWIAPNAKPIATTAVGYKYPSYRFKDLKPGFYSIRVRFKESDVDHRCLPDVVSKVNLSVGGQGETLRRVVLIMSTDTLGDIATAKGIKVGAAAPQVADAPFFIRREFNSSPLYYTPYPTTAFQVYKLSEDPAAPADPIPLAEDPAAPANPIPLVRNHILGFPITSIMANCLLWTPDLICDNFYLRPEANREQAYDQLGEEGPYFVQNAMAYVGDFVNRFDEYAASDPAIRERQIVVVNEPLLKDKGGDKQARNKYTVHINDIAYSRKFVHEIKTLQKEERYRNLESSLDRDAFYRWYLRKKADGDQSIRPYSYIVQAFEAAATAASTVKTLQNSATTLILNEKMLEFDPGKRTNAFAKLLGRIISSSTIKAIMKKNRAIRIGVGLQMHAHAYTTSGTAVDMQKNAKNLSKVLKLFRAKALSLQYRQMPIILTEMTIPYRRALDYKPYEIKTTPMAAAHRRKQRRHFHNLLQAFFLEPNCAQVAFWNYNDRSNEPPEKPDNKTGPGLDRFGLLFDEQGKDNRVCVRTDHPNKLGRKPAYFGVLQALIEAPKKHPL